MSKKIKYEISYQTEQLHWESIEIPSMTSGLLMQADMPEDSKIERYSSGFYMLTDKIPDFVKERTAYTGEMAE